MISDFAQAGTQVVLLLCLTRDYQKLLQTVVSIENHLSIVLDTFPLLPWRARSNYILVMSCKRGKGQETDSKLRHMHAMDVVSMEQDAAESWYLG